MCFDVTFVAAISASLFIERYLLVGLLNRLADDLNNVTLLQCHVA